MNRVPAGHTSVTGRSDPVQQQRGAAFDMGRLRRAMHLGVVKVGERQYAVQGTQQKAYYVDLDGDPPCTCKDVEYRGQQCKHVLAARLQARDPAMIQELGALLLAQEQHMQQLAGERKRSAK